MQLKSIFVASGIWFAGCCTCPAPPYAVQDIHPVAIASDAIQWASLDSTAIDVNVLAYNFDSLEVLIREELATLPPAESLAPWPCRWVYGTRIEPAECPDTPKQAYTVRNGVLQIDNTSTVITCLVYHTKTVKDSVWHCGPDDGVFTK